MPPARTTDVAASHASGADVGAAQLTDPQLAAIATAGTERRGAVACFTGAAGGVSEGPYATLNLGPWTDDAPTAIAANHARVIALVGGERQLRIGRQVHEARVAVHRAGAPDPDLDGVDAHVTDRHDLILAALTADCLPVALLAPWGVGIAHAGWRGLAAGVISATLDALLTLPSAQDAASVTAVTGPRAGACCYEVGPEVHAAFAGHPGAAHADPAQAPATIDLAAIAADELRGLGVGEIVDTGGCTVHDERWFSHRRSGGGTGRQAGLVWRT